MPFGPEPLGVVYFTGVKLAGYSMAGAYLRKRLAAQRPPAIVFGLARTMIGLAVGIAFASSLAALNIRNTEVSFYAVLLPVRMAERLLVIWLFFGRPAPLPGRVILKYSLIGSVWSYLLDIPAIMAIFVLPGGAWIC